MATWTKRDIELVLELRDEDWTYEEISEWLASEEKYTSRKKDAIKKMISRRSRSLNKGHLADIFDSSVNAIKEKLKKAQEHAYKVNEAQEEEVDEQFIHTLSEIDDLRDLLTGLTVPHFQNEGSPKKADFKVLSLSDLHVPFHNTDVISDALIKHADADVLVLNGDILDMYSVSQFPKSKEVLLRHEYKITLELLKLFSEMFPKVILTFGNHEYRLKKTMAYNLNPTVSFMVNDDVLDKLANGEDIGNDGRLYKRYDFDNVYYESGLLNHYAIVGKTIFVHPSFFSKVPMKTGTSAVDALKDKEDFQCIVVSHTHKCGSIIYSGKRVIEQGCCTVPMPYEASPKAKYTAQQFGYAVVYMDEDGNVDFNRSSAIYYGSDCYTKKYLKKIKAAHDSIKKHRKP